MGVAYDIIFSVIAGLPEVYPSFLICYMVYFNKMKSNLGGLSCTRGLPQPMDYYVFRIIYQLPITGSALAACCRRHHFSNGIRHAQAFFPRQLRDPKPTNRM